MRNTGRTATALATCVATILGLAAIPFAIQGQTTKTASPPGPGAPKSAPSGDPTPGQAGGDPVPPRGPRRLTPLEQVWYSGSGNQHYLLDFSGSQAKVTAGPPIGQSAGFEGTASITNPETGKLLLYSDGVTLFNGQTHRPLDNGDGLRADPSAGEAVLIAPAPGANRNLFYVFTNSITQVSYSIADLAAGPNGQVTEKNKPLASNTGEAVGIVPHANGKAFWLLVYNTAANVDAYLVDGSSGVTAKPVSSPTGLTGQVFRGSIIHSPDHNTLALGVVGHGIATAKVDRAAGKLSDVQIRVKGPDVGYSSAFSPDGTKLYYARGREGYWGNPYQLDLTTGRETRLSSTAGLGGPKLGPDGKIYWTGYRAGALGVVQKPDGAGTDANFQEAAIALNGGRGAYNLPKQTTSFTEFIPETVVAKAVEQPAEKATVKVAEEPAPKPAEKVAEKPAEKVAEKPAEKVAEKLVAAPTAARGEGPEHHQVTVGAGRVAANVDFGNVEDAAAKEPPGEIAGDMWHDQNGNGRRDPGEPALAGLLIYVDFNNNGNLDEGELSTVTDKDGHYWIGNLRPGAYAIRQVLTGGYVPPKPAPDLPVPSVPTPPRPAPLALPDRGPQTPLEQVWYSGTGTQRYLLYFSGPSLTVIRIPVGQSQTPAVASASVTDPGTGRLLLYSDGVTLFNGQTHRPLDNGDGLRADPSAGEAVLIAPAPGANRNLFYVFTNSITQVSYSIADLAAGPNGQVTEKNKPLASNTGEAVGIVPHANGKAFWLLVYNTAANVDAYLVDGSSGVTAKPVSSPTGLGRGEVTGASIIHSPDYDTLALGLVRFGIAMAKIDRTTGRITVTGLPVRGPDVGHSSAFSPDGTKLYYARGPWGIGRPYQLDLSTGRETELSSTSGFGGVKLAPNGLVYWTTWYGVALSVIQNPNAAGQGANLQVGAVNLNGSRGSTNLPAQATSYLEYVPPKPPVVPVVTPGNEFHYLVTVTPGGTTSGINFGNTKDPDYGRPPAEITGVKWHDRNGNGRRDPDEPGLPGFTIFVDLNNNAKPDEGEPATVTDSQGRYYITVKPGTYVVRELPIEGYVQTYPASSPIDTTSAAASLPGRSPGTSSPAPPAPGAGEAQAKTEQPKAKPAGNPDEELPVKPIRVVAPVEFRPLPTPGEQPKAKPAEPPKAEPPKAKAEEPQTKPAGGAEVAMAKPAVPSPAVAGVSEWSRRQDARATEVRNYLRDQAVGYEWFGRFANGTSPNIPVLNGAGIPFLLVRLLPDLDPETFGPPEERFVRFGFFDDPADPQPLPIGLGWLTEDRTPTKLEVVTLTCAACHVGRVRTAEGKYQVVVGAPNTQIDVRRWRAAIERFVGKNLNDEALIDRTTQRFLDLVASKPEGYFYGGKAPEVEKAQRGLVAKLGKDVVKAVFTTFAGRVKVGNAAVAKQLRTSYNKPNHPPLAQYGSPGQSDGNGDMIPRLLLSEELSDAKPEEVPGRVARYLDKEYPALPIGNATAVDILSTFSQATHLLGQIDNSVKLPFYRNVAAVLAITGDPRTANVRTADISAKFTAHLPPAAYPFPVDLARAERGAKIFQEHCAACHKPLNPSLYQQLGTDMNRARVLNPAGKDLFLRNFLAAVPETFEITDDQGRKLLPRKLAPDEVVLDRTRPEVQGYRADPLEGLWTRAPYLHNGSVPTLRHLLAPDNPESRRPVTFVRGSAEYDRSNVGFAWDTRDLSRLQQVDPAAAEFDTRWDGASNAGHDQPALTIDGKEYRLNWSGPENKDQLDDLLEYLKTL
jgi:hypothetical protein